MLKRFLKQHCSTLLRWYGKAYVTRQEKKMQRQCRNYTRWYQYAFAECGEYLSILGEPHIYHPELIHIGSRCHIKDGVEINPNGKIYIGNNVTLSSGAKIIANQLQLSEGNILG